MNFYSFVDIKNFKHFNASKNINTWLIFWNIFLYAFYLYTFQYNFVSFKKFVVQYSKIFETILLLLFLLNYV